MAPIKAKRIRIYVSDDEHIGAKPAHLALIEYLRRENAWGATVVRAIAGFGDSGNIRIGDRRIEGSAPLVVEWIDVPQQVERLLPGIVALAPNAPITADDVQVLQGDAVKIRALPDVLTAADVMTRDVLAVTPQTPLRDVVEGLLGKPYRAVPVVVDGIPKGIITNTDLVERGGLVARIELLAGASRESLELVLEQLSDNKGLAGDVMTREPFVVNANTRLPRVAELMLQRRLKRLPVVDGGGKLIGIVSRVDLLRMVAGGDTADEAPAASAGLADDLPLSQVMRRNIPTVAPDATLAELCQAITSTRLNRALVVDESGRAIGGVSDAVVLEGLSPALRPRALGALMHRAPFDEGGSGSPKARELMTTDVLALREDTALGTAIAKMLQGKHKVLAVTDADGRLVGVADRADLLRGIMPSGT